MDAQLEWSGQGELAQKKKPAREDLEAFETAYNAACGSISRGELAQGEICLKRAKDLCNSLGDLSDAEKKAELLPMTVQHVYLLTQMGRNEEAEQMAATIPFTEYEYLALELGCANSLQDQGAFNPVHCPSERHRGIQPPPESLPDAPSIPLFAKTTQERPAFLFSTQPSAPG